MAKFDISPGTVGVVSGEMLGSILKAEEANQATYEPAPRARRLDSDCTRMRAKRQVLGSFVRGMVSPGRLTCMWACFLGVTTAAAADPARPPPTATIPDPPPPPGAPRVPATHFRPSWDLDGIYLWLGPTGAASHVDSEWDSTFGGHAAVLRVREREALGVIGGAFGASLWTERSGGRIWLDAMIGTRVWGRMIGASLGPILELGDLAHPRPGASLGVWTFIGVTPFARIGFVDELGGFGEIGLHIALPVLRR
jgi:hypothetical protein